MKTFKGYLNETFQDWKSGSAPAWTESLSTMLFDLPRAGLVDIHVPLSPSIMKRIWPKSIRSKAFHVTDMNGVAKLKGMQKGKRSIAAFYNIDDSMIDYGIKTEGGYVVELEGDVLAASPDDVSSQPDKSGRRWITVSTLMNSPFAPDPGLGGKAKLRGMEKDIENMLWGIIKTHAEYPELDWSINKAWPELRTERVKDGKIMSLIIRDYIDGMEKIMKKYSRKLGPLFKDYTKIRTMNLDPDSGDYPQWDELVVNNFTIKKIHVGYEWESDFEGDADIEGFPFERWNDDQKLSDHIAKIVKKGK